MEWTLRSGDQSAVVCALGGRLRRFQAAGVDVLAGRENPEQFAFRGSLLAPWPNRVVGGRWTWQGETYQLPVNDAGAGAALHGLVFDQPFLLRKRNQTNITLTHDLVPSDGYPFPLQLQVSYALGTDGLSCTLTARNTGAIPVPVGLGVHGYVEAHGLVDDLVLTVPATTLLETDKNWRELRRLPVSDTSLDFRQPRLLGELCVDAAFTNLSDDAARVQRPDGTGVVLRWGPTARWLVVYTGHTLPRADHRRSIAIEPQTCPPNALATGEIDVLAPGAELALAWRYQAVTNRLA